MNRRHLSALISVELKRSGPFLLRLMTILIGFVAFLAVIGKATAENVSATLIGSTLGYVVLVPTGLSRDKIDGALEFLCSLPTTAATIVTARFAATAIILLPGALQIALTYALFAPDMPMISRPAAALSLFLLSWISLSAASWLLIALLVRFKLQTLAGAPMLGVALLIFAATIFGDRAPPPAAIFEFVVAKPWAPAALTGAVLAIFMAVAATAALLATRAVARFHPRADEISY